MTQPIPNLPTPNLNDELQLGRFYYVHQDTREKIPAILGSLLTSGLYLGQDEVRQSSEGLSEAIDFAQSLANTLDEGDCAEHSDTDTSYLPFVLPNPLSPAKLQSSVMGWLHLAPTPQGQSDDLFVSIDPSGFRIADILDEHEAAEDAEDYYELEQLEAIRDAQSQFSDLNDPHTIWVTVNQVATLVINMGRTSSGYWTGIATLRIDT